MPIRKRVLSSTATGFLAALILALASPARGDDSATEQARQHYVTGTQQYDLGHWDDSIREFEKAYELRPDPSFLYNLAQAYRRKGDTKRALDLYRNYLAKVPKSPQRAEIEERIKGLQKQIEETASAKPAPSALEPTVTPPALPASPAIVPAPAETATTSSPQAGPALTPEAQPAPTTASPPPEQPGQATPASTATTSGPAAAVADAPSPAPRGRGLRIAGIVCGAVGAAEIVLGVAYGLQARSLSNKVAGAQTFNPSDDSAGLRDEKLQWSFLGGGLLVGAVGGVLYYFGVRAARTTPSGVSLAPVVGPGTAGVSAMGVF
jgi:tetratricopeptide (TPR) repeat protein